MQARRPKRAKVIPEESIRRIESFTDRKEQIVAVAATPALGDSHPLNDIIGAYEGPARDRVLKNIKRNRKKEDAEALAESE